MKHLFTLAILCFALNSFAWKIDSSYTIVIPERPLDRSIARAYQEGAETLRYALERGGIKVGIKKSLKAVPGKKSIFLGFSDGKKRTHFNGAIRIANRDIYLCGNDFPGNGKPADNNSLKICFLGTYTALTAFMREYLDCPFVLPCKEALQVGKMADLPEKLEREIKAPLVFGSGRWTPMLLFDYANANFGRGSTRVYGGHSHDKAVPQSKYGRSNPEYYSFAKGRRYNLAHYHGHCLSNPAVEELIYKEMLKHLDAGYEMVELGQSDGNIPCECKKCFAMPGGKDHGERLWQFHLKLAERLEKDRPGKKVLIICYWPNLDPPRTPKKLPANVTVELTRDEKGHFDKWRGYEVPGGFYIYIYNWGSYQPEGFTPKNCNLDFLEKQVRSFQKMGIKGLYRCGYWELPGLEGPAYYVYGQLWHRPKAAAKELFEEYCSRVFGKGAPEMAAFYRLLYSRQKYSVLPEGTTRWSHLLRQKRKLGELALNQALFAKRYPPQIIAELKSLMARGFAKMDTPGARWIRPYIEKEFSYLENTAQIANCMNRLLSKNDHAAGVELLKYLDGRRKAVKALASSAHLRNSLGLIQTGGSMYGTLNFPYQMDSDSFIKNGITLCGRKMKVNGAPQLLIKDRGNSHPVKVGVSADETTFKVRFYYQNYSASQLGEDKINFYIENAQGKMLKFQTWLTPKAAVYASEVVKNSTQNQGGNELLKRVTPRGAKFTLTDSKEKKAVAEFSIPFALLGGKPAPGTLRKFNASCLRYLPGNNKKQDGIAFWEVNFGKLNWKQDMARYGKVEF